MTYLFLFLFAATSAHAGTNLPVSFSKSVCVSDYPNTLAALAELDKRVDEELASCTAGVFEHAGAMLELKSITVETHFSHMCTGGDREMSAQVQGTCVVP